MERERRKKGEGAGWRTRAYKGEEERGGGVRKKRRERWEGRITDYYLKLFNRIVEESVVL